VRAPAVARAPDARFRHAKESSVHASARHPNIIPSTSEVQLTSLGHDVSIDVPDDAFDELERIEA
jgi:hypothetical protein